MPVLDWKDFAVVLCLFLVIVGAGALAVAAHTFSIIKGRVLEEGRAVLDRGDRSYPTRTISVLIENDDRVFQIKRGTVVEYAISDGDAELVGVGSEVELLVSFYSGRAKVISPDDH